LGLSSGKQKDGLKTGVVILIVLVAMTIVGLMFKMVVQKRLREEGRTAAPKNAIKDQSQALQLEADGQIFRDAVKSSTSHAPQTDDYFFESPDGVLVEATELPKTHSFESSDSGPHII
jgi:cytoskeletal protein RodZ